MTSELMDGQFQVLAGPGDHGFACHRIPALTLAPNGDLLAAWDGRPGCCDDSPNPNSIIQRRSTDGGRTWGPVTTVAAGHVGPVGEKFGYSDPSYVTDRVTGVINVFFVKSFDVSCFESGPGVDPSARDVLHAAVTRSDDDGHSWTEPQVITAAITARPELYRARFAASGEGIQLRYGAYAGRLIQQYTFARVSGEFEAVSVFSDDHGASWQAGSPVGVRMDENKVVELSDGRVMVNSRASDETRCRKVTVSDDGGRTYGEVVDDTALVDPRNNASIIRAFPDAPQGSAEAQMLLFTNAASATDRVNGTISVSFDDGRTWPTSKVVVPGSFSYSTLTALAEPGRYGLLYEGADTHICFMTVSLGWLGVQP